MATHFDEQAALRRAYLTLLELPHTDLRIRLQSVLATLRDEIAAIAGMDPQEVQDRYEMFVAHHPSEYVPSGAKVRRGKSVGENSVRTARQNHRQNVRIAP